MGIEILWLLYAVNGEKRLKTQRGKQDIFQGESEQSAMVGEKKLCTLSSKRVIYSFLSRARITLCRISERV